MSADVNWIVGTGLVLAGLMSAHSAGVSAQFAAVDTRLDDQIARATAEHAEIRTEIRRLDNWLHTLSLAVKPAPPAK